MNPSDFSVWGVPPDKLDAFADPPKKIQPPQLKPGAVTLAQWAEAFPQALPQVIASVEASVAAFQQAYLSQLLAADPSSTPAQVGTVTGRYTKEPRVVPPAPAPKPPALVFGKEPRRVILP